MTELKKNLNYRQACFLTSASKLSQCPSGDCIEVAFAGRSNAGKSSALNTLTGSKKLARISKTPGRTQLINYFTIKDGIYLVDLPGYGYAKVPETMKENWLYHMNDYLTRRKSLVGLVLLMDIRHPMKEYDLRMLEWSVESRLPIHILLTKSDKLKQGVAKQVLMTIKTQLKNIPLTSVQQFSSLKKNGIDELAEKLNCWLTVDTNIEITDD